GKGIQVEGIILNQPTSGGGVRVGLTTGIKVVNLGLGGAWLRSGGDNAFISGGELSLRLTPWGEKRTPVIEPFLRADYSSNGDFFPVLGGRLLLDLL
ncbi:MAG TPA: hypothetical protein VM513_01020, partial [Kofleriaceae bacterium]|nr:hypothetical protein [Kofleriaceae bacterium]